MRMWMCICVTATDGKEVSPPAESEEESADRHAAQSAVKPGQPRVQALVTHRHR